MSEERSPLIDSRFVIEQVVGLYPYLRGKVKVREDVHELNEEILNKSLIPVPKYNPRNILSSLTNG